MYIKIVGFFRAVFRPIAILLPTTTNIAENCTKSSSGYLIRLVFYSPSIPRMRLRSFPASGAFPSCTLALCLLLSSVAVTLQVYSKKKNQRREKNLIKYIFWAPGRLLDRARKERKTMYVQYFFWFFNYGINTCYLHVPLFQSTSSK